MSNVFSKIIKNGAKYAIDETCLPIKIFLGQIDYLKDKCDYIFLPRIDWVECGEPCLNFKSLYDLANNTFRNYNLKFLFYNNQWKKPSKEITAYLKMCKFLGIKESTCKYAYNLAKQAQMFYEMFRAENQLDKKLLLTKMDT